MGSRGSSQRKRTWRLPNVRQEGPESGLNLREWTQPSQAAGAARVGAVSLLRAWKAKCRHAILHGRQTVPDLVKLMGKRRVSTIFLKGRLLFVIFSSPRELYM